MYYPHAVRKLYVINAPSIFTWMWKLVKPWLDPFTANSMSILGSNYYEILSKEIPPENFPKEYPFLFKRGERTQRTQRTSRAFPLGNNSCKGALLVALV